MVGHSLLHLRQVEPQLEQPAEQLGLSGHFGDYTCNARELLRVTAGPALQGQSRWSRAYATECWQLSGLCQVVNMPNEVTSKS